MRLLLIEDNARLTGLISDALRKQAFTVDTVASAGDAQAALTATFYDLMILDLGLPDYDGTELLAWLRGRGLEILVLVLTARESTQAVIESLNGEADDFLRKSFDMEELIARVRALLRRPGKPLGIRLSEGNLVFDTIGHDVRVNNMRVDLSRLEAGALALLMRSSGCVVPKSVLGACISSRITAPTSASLRARPPITWDR
jgi:DNA-binding response OmpR family regulator